MNATEIAAPEADPLQQCLDAEQRQRLRSLVAALPQRLRTVVFLYYYEERTQAEIAEVFEVSRARVNQLHATAISRLREAFIN